MNNHLLIKKRLLYTKFIGQIIARLPFVRCVILTGSLVEGHASQHSDIDILIIARAGRIFSARFFVNAFGTIFGIKRSKDETKNHAGKFCFNYFLADNYLMLPVGRGEKIDHYCAKDYSRSKFIAGDKELHKQFLSKNKKLFEKYGFKISNVRSGVISTPRPSSRAEKSFKLNNDTIKRSLHGVYPALRCGVRDDRKVGRDAPISRFEKWAKKYQINKIESDPITKKYPDLIVYNDKELRFHPPKS
jgi:predicted nucleotidyltransferase